MQKWQYTAVLTQKSLTEELNNFGEEGWECISIKVVDNSYELVFKRPA